MLKKIYTFAFALLTAHLTFSQINWQPLNGPHGADRMNIRAVDQSGRVFLTRSNRLYTSTDNGDNWVGSGTGIPANNSPYISQLQVLPSGKVVALVSGIYYLYNPADNSWSIDNTLAGIKQLSIDDQQRFWQVKDEDIYYSTDGGQSYTLVLNGVQSDGWHHLMANHSDEHNLVAVKSGTKGKLYHFSTTGTLSIVMPTFSADYLGYNSFSGTAFAVNTDLNWRSTDGGLNWNELKVYQDPNTGSSATITNLFFVSGTEIWATTDKGVFISTDDGATWEFPPGFNIDTSIDYFFRKPDGTLFANTACSAFEFARSTDNGKNWTDLSGQFNFPSVEQIHLASKDILFAKNCGTFERSVDGGQTWAPAQIKDSLSYPLQYLYGHPDGDLFSLSPKSNFLHSTDYGNNWTSIVKPLNALWAGKPGLATDFYGNIYAFYSGDSEFSYKSIDKGQNWKPIRFTPYYYLLSRPAIMHQNGDIYMIDGSFIHHYVAAQDTAILTQLFLPGSGYIQPIEGVVTAQGALVLIGYNSSVPGTNLYHYMGNGLVEKLNFPGKLPTLIAASPATPVFVVSRDSVFQSDNSGLFWTFSGKLPTGAPFYALKNIQIGNDLHLYLSYDRDVVYRSAKSVASHRLITGTAWHDENGNCQREPNEPTLINRFIKAQGGIDYATYSGSSGKYRIYVPDGTYTLSVQPPNALFAACPPVTVTVDDQQDTAYADVALYPVAQCPYLRVSATTPRLRRCFANTYTLQYANEGTAAATGVTVEITLDSLFEFISASIPPAGQNGPVLTFDIGDIAPGASGKFQIEIKVSCLAALGQEHCFQAQILPGAPCLPDLRDLSVTQECQANTGAFDPNDKRVFVQGREEPGAVAPDTNLEYLIRFQNTGTDTAFNVVVEDRLPGVLELSSVVPLVASHPYGMELGPERQLRFVFDNILLPDSNINEAASHGFIKFAVRQLPKLPGGTTIRNTANIYFDFNATVTTNTSELMVTLPVRVYTPTPGYAVQVFPNPFHDAVTFRVSGPAHGYTLLLTDAVGRAMRQEEFAGDTFQMQRNDLPAGMYFFIIFDANGRRVVAGRVLAE